MESTKETTQIEESYKVPNLEKGIAVLELLSASNKGLSLQEIKISLDISQTTAYRILNTLVRLGYLKYIESKKQYQISRKLLTLGLQSLEEHGLLEIILPYLKSLRDEIKETVCYGVMGNGKIVFVEQALGSHPFCFVLTPGKIIDLHCSAPGKAMLAAMPDGVRDNFIKTINYTVYNENTIVSEADLLRELAVVREQGYAVDKEEEMIGVVCVGAAVLDCHGYPIGSIWFSGPKSRLNNQQIALYGSVLTHAAKEISLELGCDIKDIEQ